MINYKDNGILETLESLIWDKAYDIGDGKKHLHFSTSTGIIYTDREATFSNKSDIIEIVADHEEVLEFYLNSLEISIEKSWLNNFKENKFSSTNHISLGVFNKYKKNALAKIAESHPEYII